MIPATQASGVMPAQVASSTPATRATTSPSLLAAPEGSFDIDHALTELLKVGSSISEAQTKGAKSSADSAGAARKDATARRKQALADAVETARQAAEERDSGGFFEKITKNLGPVGLVGMYIGSVYVVAADLAAHAVGLEDDKLDLADAGGLAAMATGPLGVAVYASELCMKKFGPDEIQRALDNAPTVKDDDVRTANKVALIVTQAELAAAATIASGGSTVPLTIAMIGIAVSTTAQVMQETGATKAIFGEDARWVTLGATLAGAAMSIVGGVACGVGAANSARTAATSSQELAKAARVAEEAKTSLQAAHDVNQGIHNLHAAELEHRADDFKIDAQQQKHVIEFVERMVDTIIDDMKNIKESAQKTTELLQGALQTRSQTMLLAGNMKA